jgi:hypothetical protein
MGFSSYEKEYLVILMAVEQWRPYLQHGEFIIFTDQRGLIHLSDQRLNTPWQQKVFTKLGLQYQIVYKQGSTNRVADALSQRPTADCHLTALSVCQPSWTTEIVAGYVQDSTTQDILSKVIVSRESVPQFELKDGLLRFKGRIWIGDNSSLQLRIMSALHCAPAGGHSGFPVTYRHIK